MLQADTPDVLDYLNSGHTAWVQGNTERAVSLYLKGCRAKGDTESFIDLLFKDREELERQHVSPDDLTLMADVLRYGEGE